MRAVSIPQPFAALLIIGAKTYETKAWGTTYRGPLAIHTPWSYEPWARALAEQQEYFDALRARRLYGWNLPRSCFIGVADLVGCHDIREDGVVAGARVCTLERRFGDFRRGRFAWQLANPRLLKAPINARGRRGLFEWETPADLELQLTLKTPAELTA